MKLTPSRTVIPAFVALGLMGMLAGCNSDGSPTNATVSQVASDACLVMQAINASALSLSATQKASVTAGVTACNAIQNGTSINLATDTAAALSALVVLQQAGLIPAAKALAPNARMAKHRLELDLRKAEALGYVK